MTFYNTNQSSVCFIQSVIGEKERKMTKYDSDVATLFSLNSYFS